MVIEPDPQEKRDALERPLMPPNKPARAPWLALVAVLFVCLIGWWAFGGHTVDPETTSSIAPATDVAPTE